MYCRLLVAHHVYEQFLQNVLYRTPYLRDLILSHQRNTLYLVEMQPQSFHRPTLDR